MKLKLKPTPLLIAIALLLVTNIVTLVLWLKPEASPSMGGMKAGSEVVATVGDDSISREEWLYSLEQKYGEQELKQMVNHKVIEKIAKKYNITVSEKEVNKEYELIRSAYHTFDEEYTEDEETVKAQIRTDLLLEELLTKDVEVPEADMKKFYEQNEEMYQIPKMFGLKQIVVSDRSEADQVIKELEGGSSFDVLAMERSIDAQSAHLGGDIGYIPEESELLTGDAVSELGSLSKGEWSRPVKSGSGYTVYLLEGSIDEKHFSYEDVKSQIRRQLAIEQVETPLIPESFWDEAGVEWFYGVEQ
ncbi:peptidyl-prolyl cis-trans isomerase [Rossellomorea aquimaris]|uniref:peptidyl-prolyl cis-trans isomerase n=1 Tax=Rossellomorea aquimaris TaxID=189382 RepID=UPI001CD37D9D|nr:peptidyl-prolyl cis-trans isomerase [Rossellomorea aquimaris]MCA1057282.1 peptidyl-prolyl cis-trans isomerase [Rossellomorea aquimaris]